MKTVFLITIILTSFCGIAQKPEMTQDLVDVYKVDDKISGLESIMIPVDFNDSDPLKNIPDSINDLTIQRIDLVYTANKENPDFDQEALNTRRTKTFLKKFPKAGDDLVAWREVGQYSATTREEAKDLFHGFVIYYRPTPSKESIKKEIDYIDEMLGFKEEETTTGDNEISPDSEEVEIVYDHTESVSADPVIFNDEDDILDRSLKTAFISYDEDCFVIHEIKFYRTPAEMKEFADSLLFLPELLGTTYTYNTTGKIGEDDPRNYTFKWAELKEGCDKITSTITYDGLEGFSTTTNFKTDYEIVQTVFERNANWQKALVVMDVTGSMSPYIGKTMAWLKERSKSEQISAFVFFNDGDSKPTSAKTAGNVGGVYMALNKNFDAVYDRMKYTMRKGGGGDCPENNVEATIKGIKAYPDSEEIVMVADNWATPRDLALVKILESLFTLFCVEPMLVLTYSTFNWHMTQAVQFTPLKKIWTWPILNPKKPLNWVISTTHLLEVRS